MCIAYTCALIRQRLVIFFVIVARYLRVYIQIMTYIVIVVWSSNWALETASLVLPCLKLIVTCMCNGIFVEIRVISL